MGWTNKYRKTRTEIVPSFESGIIPEPLLLFGGRHEHVDPKTGIALYGPYTPGGHSKPLLTSIKVGIVGPSSMVADTESWLNFCSKAVLNDGTQPFLYPHFPGFNNEHPFQCDLIYGAVMEETISNQDYDDALAKQSDLERVSALVKLYVGAIEVLSQRDPRPDVILCCIPKQVVDLCTTGKVPRKQPTGSRLKAISKKEGKDSFKQLSLFEDIREDLEEDDEAEDRVHKNLRRGIKAEAMRYGIPTQLVWPRTLETLATTGSARKSQDAATRAWNFFTAMYHKAGGSPWRLAENEQGVCYVGVSFYRELFEPEARMRTSMAQAFTATGDGYVLRGKTFEWDEQSRGRSPHLDFDSALSLMQGVLDLYKRQNKGALPTRVVVHKSSRFWEDEKKGFVEACESVPKKDFVALGWRGIQFYRKGDFPALRGSYIKFSDTNLAVYAVGYVPFLRTYPGARVPNPVEILEHDGDSPWNVILSELLALTKMNWNTADFSCAKPVTLAFSERVAQILAELSPGDIVRPEYRFYM